MAVALTAAAVLSLASAYPDWNPDWVRWQVLDAGTGNGESSGRPDAYNPAGPFRGLMQIWDANAVRFGYKPEDMYDPAKNIAAAHRLWLESGTAPWPSAVKYPGRTTMGISADGWLDWAIRLPATVNHVNGGTNPVKGIFLHSAEGFATTLLDPTSKWGYNGDLSWHLTNCLDGKLYQHYPFTAQCWHATAANNEFVGMENEGLTPQGQAVGPPLNAAQIANAQRVIASLAAWKGWTPKRPIDANDKTATLYQHGEVVRFGGTGSTCPNGRIPWDLILATEDYGPMNLNADGSDRIVSEDGFVVVYHQNAPVWRWGGDTPGEVAKNFGGSWYSLAHLKQDDDPGPGQQSPAVWSNTVAD